MNHSKKATIAEKRQWVERRQRDRLQYEDMLANANIFQRRKIRKAIREVDSQINRKYEIIAELEEIDEIDW